MFAVRPAIEIPPPAPVPRLLVELPSRPRVFFSNLRDVVFPRRFSEFELRSTPAEFWPDVFVKRGLPWYGFLRSGFYHVLACTLLVVLTRFFALQPQVVIKPTFERSQVIYYPASEYLPPLDTRTDSPAAQPAKADPEFSRQPIINVPSEADNHSQTIVTPPNIKLKQDIALPNMVAWSDSDEIKPRLAIPPAPLTPASDITRMAPKLENSVVTPPPNAADLTHRRDLPTLQTSVVAPPPELRSSNVPSAVQGLQPALIAPPPTVDSASTRPLRDLNIAPSAVIAPAPQLPVSAQRSLPGGRLATAGGAAPQVVPPPPSLSASGSSGASAGSRGRVVALNLHPAVGAPPSPPAGNRRGSFAATPEGRPGSSGSPGSTSSGAGTGSALRGGGKGNGSGATGKSDLPAGLYVGTTTAKTSGVAGDPANTAATNSVNPNLVASVRPPRVTAPRPLQPDNAANLSEPERAIFANRKFYSVTLNMPNLNSAGGSWVIRFAELKRDSSNHDPNTPAADLSQPFATRKVDPAYPVQLMRENVAGTVILYAVIHSDGKVNDVRVLRSVDERLDRYAMEAVAQWQFEPATKNGAPVAVEATFQIPFRPARVGTNF